MTKKIVLTLTLAVVMAASTVIAQQSARQSGGNRNASGERIIELFDIHSAELRSVMRQLSVYSGTDIIVSESARANVTISVTNRTWRQVLDIICMVHNLAYHEDGSFIYVMPRGEAIARGIGVEVDATASGTGVPSYSAAPSAGGAAGDGAPLMREVVPMRYTTAGEVSAAITPFLSQRGRLTTVQHTNSIVLVDTDDNIKQLKQLIDQIDIQTPQISISCKIIEVSSGVIQSMGMGWGYTDQGSSVTAGQFWTPESPPNFGFGGNITGGGSGGSSGSGNTGNSVNSVGMGGGHTLRYGVLTSEKLQIRLNYLFEDNKAEVVAQPQITTLNNQQASIFMGAQIPINTRDDAGNTVTQMVNAGTRLTVTPYVSGEGKIRLALNPSKESYQLSSDGTPVITEQSATTNVLVGNGETVVIAGLTSNERMEAEAGIPLLKNIPIIGNLFKRSTKSSNKKDLVIFVTPHILHSDI